MGTPKKSALFLGLVILVVFSFFLITARLIHTWWIAMPVALLLTFLFTPFTVNKLYESLTGENPTDVIRERKEKEKHAQDEPGGEEVHGVVYLEPSDPGSLARGPMENLPEGGVILGPGMKMERIVPRDPWVVYDYDGRAYPIAIFEEEIEALRYVDDQGYGFVRPWPYGTRWSDR